MNLPLSPPSPPLWAGERVAEGRERGTRTGSWSQGMRESGRRLSMNREFQVRSRAESGGAPPHSKTLARWLRRPEHPPGFGVRR